METKSRYKYKQCLKCGFWYNKEFKHICTMEDKTQEKLDKILEKLEEILKKL